MNYFGMFFTYMIPGIVIGIIVAAAFAEGGKRKRRNQARENRVMPAKAAKAVIAQNVAPEREPFADNAGSAPKRKNKLYVCTLTEDAA